MTAHSRIGASSAYRWLECPGSIPLSEAAPPQISSSYADEGTAAHNLAEKCLDSGQDADKYIGLIIKVGKTDFEVDEEMAENVQLYLDVVREDIERWDDISGVETRIHLKWIHEDMFGTSDSHAGLRGARLVVHDYKHGAGITVDAVENSQGLYYVLGIAAKYEFQFEEYEFVIVQPRAHHPDGPVRRWVFTKERLKQFERELKVGLDRVEKARESNKIIDWLNPGDHCRFCPAALDCPALERQMELAVFEDFSHIDDDILTATPTPPNELSPERLKQALEFASIFEAWIGQVRSYAYQRAEEGNPPEGFKLVQKYGHAKHKDPEKTVDVLTLLGFTPEQIFEAPKPPKVKSPAQLKKLFTKKSGVDKKFLRHFTMTPETGSALVPVGDRRAELVNRVEDDFAAVTDETE